jgi:hypothetical protein
VLQFRRSLAQRLEDFRPHHDYSLSQMTLAVMYPIILGLDRLENASLLRSDSTWRLFDLLTTWSPHSSEHVCPKTGRTLP